MASSALASTYRPLAAVPGREHDARSLVANSAARPQTNIRVLIADHQPLSRHGLCAAIGDDPDMAVVAEAGTGEEALALARRFQPDVVVLDLHLPVGGGLAATRSMRAACPQSQVLVAGIQDDTSATEAARAGACASISRASTVEGLLRTIRAAAAGGSAPGGPGARLMRVVRRPEGLSERETEVLCLVARGLANKQIASTLNIRQSTVKAHVGSILGKLGFLTRTQAALFAAQVGLVPLDGYGVEVAFPAS
jgi:DNA-binding NarL/FixJ family response regulator